MGGTNPFIQSPDVVLPTRKFQIKFLPEGTVVNVDPKNLPYSTEGQQGSILEIAIGHDVDMDHACGGVCACSTCHVIVHEGFESLPEATEDEEDQLDNAPGLTRHSRLSCQAVPDGSCDLVVEIPNWNRNLVGEEH